MSQYLTDVLQQTDALSLCIRLLPTRLHSLLDLTYSCTPVREPVRGTWNDWTAIAGDCPAEQRPRSTWMSCAGR